MFFTDNLNFLKDGVCLRDFTFDWTQNANDYLKDNAEVKKRYIIFASFLMDCMLGSYFIVFFFYGKTYRAVIGYMFFFSTRAFLQVSIIIECNVRFRKYFSCQE